MSDLFEKIGREVDMYHRFSLDPVRIEVSPEADLEIKTLLHKSPLQTLRWLKIDSDFISYSVNPKMLGVGAFKIHTRLTVTPPEVAIRKAFIHKSKAIPNELFTLHPKLRLS